MSIISLLLGLIAAVIVFVVLTALVAFPHSVLVFGLVAVVVFLAIAFSGARVRL